MSSQHIPKTNCSSLEPERDLSFPEIEFKPEDYADLLSDLNLSEVETNDFLLTLWNIMRIFVEMGLRPNNILVNNESMLEKTGADSDTQVEIFNTASTTEKG